VKQIEVVLKEASKKCWIVYSVAY